MSRSPRSQPWARLVATAGLCALAVLPLSACGVPLQRQAEPLPAEALPTVQAQTTVVPPVELTDVFFVSGPFLEPVAEALPARTPEEVMAALAREPTPQRDDELRTLLVAPTTAEPVLVVESATSDQVVLRSTEEYLLLPANDQVLLVGQVVHSMAAIGVGSVLITDESGAKLAPARPDGLSLEEPATAQDYASLLRPP